MAADIDAVEMFGGLVGAIRGLTEDSGYQVFSKVFHEVKELKERNSRLTTSHREMFEEYRDFRNELEANEAQLNAAKNQAETTLQEREDELASLTEEKKKVDGELSDTKATLAQLEEAKSQVDQDLQNAQMRVEELAAFRDKLKGDIAQANEKIEEQEKQAEVAAADIAALQGTVADRDAEVGKLQGDIKAIEEREQQAVEKLQGDVKATEEREQSALSLAEERQTIVNTLQGDLDSKNRTLETLESYRVELQDDSEDVLVAISDTIWRETYHLVESHFRKDLEPKVLADSSCWSNLRNSEYLHSSTRIPLPQSNTPAAKAMRIVAVLTVLSRTLHKYIFRPLYLLDDDVKLSRLLREAEALNPGFEEHLRATLLAILPDRQRDNAKKRVQAVVREVSSVVQHLLGSLEYDKFCEGLCNLCTLACTQWTRVQMARMKIDTAFGPPYDDGLDWQELPPPVFGLAKRRPLTPSGSDTAVDETVVAPEDTKTDDKAGESEDAAAAAAAPSTAEGDAAVVDDDDGEDSGDDEDDEIRSRASGPDPENILVVVWPSMCVVEGGELTSITQGIVVSRDQARLAQDEMRPMHTPRSNTKKARTMSIPSRSRSGSPFRTKTLTPLVLAEGDGIVGG